MADFLSRLASRTLSPQTTVRPDLLPVASSGSLEPATLEGWNPQPPAPFAASSQRQREQTPGAQPTSAPLHTDVAPLQALAAPAEPPPLPAAPRQPRIEAERAALHAVLQGPQEPELTRALPLNSTRPFAATAVAHSAPASNNSPTPPAVYTATSHAAPVQPLIQPAPQPEPLVASAATTAPGVRVSIGRVDVRAAPAPATPARPAPRPANPALSLHDYLRERNRGWR